MRAPKVANDNAPRDIVNHSITAANNRRRAMEGSLAFHY